MVIRKEIYTLFCSEIARGEKKSRPSEAYLYNYIYAYITYEYNIYICNIYIYTIQ
jgi:hypothetical protein